MLLFSSCHGNVALLSQYRRCLRSSCSDRSYSFSLWQRAADWHLPRKDEGVPQDSPLQLLTPRSLKDASATTAWPCVVVTAGIRNMRQNEHLASWSLPVLYLQLLGVQAQAAKSTSAQNITAASICGSTAEQWACQKMFYKKLLCRRRKGWRQEVFSYLLESLQLIWL